MRNHPWRAAVIGSTAVVVVVLAGIAGVAGSAHVRCPEERDVLVFGPASADDAPVYEELSDVVAIVARDVGYRSLTSEDLERIATASAAAVASGADEADANLRDTEAVVDLHVAIQGSERTGYLVGGGSFCARVSNGTG